MSQRLTSYLLADPVFVVGKRTLHVSWSESLCNYGDAVGVGGCTVALASVETVSVETDPCDHQQSVLTVAWPNHVLVTRMIKPVNPRGLSEPDVDAAWAANCAAGREKCIEVATRLRAAMESE